MGIISFCTILINLFHNIQEWSPVSQALFWALCTQNRRKTGSAFTLLNSVCGAVGAGSAHSKGCDVHIYRPGGRFHEDTELAELSS